MENDTSYIYLSDFLLYNEDIGNDNFLPSNDIIVLKNKDDKVGLVRRIDLNSYIKVHIFTDLLGLLGQESNGLIQTEISSNIVFISRPITANNRHVFILFHYLEPSFILKKFDSEYAYQTISDTVPPFTIDRTKFNQLSYIDLGLKLNVIRLKSLKHTFDLLNIGIELKYSDVKFINIEDVKTYNEFGIFIETIGQLLEYRNFGYEYGLQVCWQKLNYNEIENYKERYPFLILESSLFYYPKGNRNNILFVRLNNVYNTVDNDFYNLLQFGYRTKLNLK
ncbi:MAG: hypothetical protein K8R74_12410 [Bacteroidales bacterium]|nr:hypothetical protein [Bacteroidales bacterium]